jgi:tRNA 2-thiocytidine biosynthesis protein TtcA
MLDDWERASPGRVESIFNAICNVEPSHLADPEAFDFSGLERTVSASGD